MVIRLSGEAVDDRLFGSAGCRLPFRLEGSVGVRERGGDPRKAEAHLIR